MPVLMRRLPVLLIFLFLFAGCGAGRTMRSAKPVTPTVAGKGVVLYTRASCPYCNGAKAYFTDRGISFVDRDIEKDPAALVEMLSIYREKMPDEEPIVPLIIIDGAALSGFDPPEVEKALRPAPGK